MEGHLEGHQTLDEFHPPTPLTFIIETFPPERHQQEPQQVSQSTPPIETPQIDMVIADHPPPASEFSQDFYTEANTRRVQPPRARRTDFGKHTADELIIDAIERAEKEKPVIPPETVFFCTTDNSMMPNMHEVLSSIHPAGTSSVDELPMHSYFRDPEVMRKIRSQETIETPSWRVATEQDWMDAVLEIPEPWRSIPPDTSLGYYRRTQVKMERMEASVRNREKDKLAHDYHHLKGRLSELQQLDATGFRGETLTGQEKDKVLVLSVAKKLLENQRVKGEVGEKDVVDGAEDGLEEAVDDKGTTSNKASATKPPRKKKESKWQYYPADYDLDGEIIGDTSKKKKPKRKPPVRSDATPSGASKKRKREETELEIDEYPDYGLVLEPDGEEDEYLEGAERQASIKKAKAQAAPRRSMVPSKAVGSSVWDKEKDPKLSKLLDTAKKYNPKRAPRDIYPFGAPMPEPESGDFDLPVWLTQELDVYTRHPTPTTTPPVDEATGTSMPMREMESMTTTDLPAPEIQAPVKLDTKQPTDEEVANDFVETTFHPESPEYSIQARKPFSNMEDAESSGLSELSDEDRDTNPGDGTLAEGQEEEEAVNAMEEEYGEEEDAYPSQKPSKQRRSTARGSSIKNKKPRRR